MPLSTHLSRRRHRSAGLLTATAVLAVFGSALPANARNEPTFPRLEADVLVEIENDYTVESDDPDAELNDLFATIEPALALRLTRALSIESSLVLEPVRDPGPGDDRVFEDHGLFAEELYLNYETSRFAVYGGKFNPSFGTAWDMAPGIYGVDFAEDYEITERIGGGGALKFGGDGLGGDGFGTHRIALNGYFADTSFLSGSAFTNRGRLDKADGGASNTEDLSSFSLTLDGGGIPGLPVNYHLGLRHQEGGPGTPEDETGVVAGVNGSFALSPEVTVEPIFENAYIEDFDGTRQDRNYLTAGSSVLIGPWNVAASYTGRTIDPPGGGSFTDDQFQLSGGYAFDFGLTADVGYKYVEESGVESHVLGVLFAYNFDFALPR